MLELYYQTETKGNEMTTVKIRARLYETTDDNGTLWIIEHVSKADGFSYEEWHCGTEEYPHEDQYNTKRECLEAIEHWQNNH